jgi:PadR family transcriptional regulator AphA
MSLKYAILGLLDMNPMSGYDLKKIFDGGLRYYWEATHTQIYRTLNVMEKESYLQVEVIIQSGVPNKNQYSITDLGKKMLINWLSEPANLPSVKNEFLVKLTWGDNLSKEALDTVLENHIKRLEYILNLYDIHKSNNIFESARTTREKILWASTLDLGIRTCKTEVEWAKDLIEQLNQET